MPLYFDDVTDDKFLSKITEGFDDGEVYETTEVWLKHIWFYYKKGFFWQKIIVS